MTPSVRSSDAAVVSRDSFGSKIANIFKKKTKPGIEDYEHCEEKQEAVPKPDLSQPINILQRQKSRQTGSERHIDVPAIKETSSGSKISPEKLSDLNIREYPLSVPKSQTKTAFNFGSPPDDFDLLGSTVETKERPRATLVENFDLFSFTSHNELKCGGTQAKTKEDDQSRPGQQPPQSKPEDIADIDQIFSSMQQERDLNSKLKSLNMNF